MDILRERIEIIFLKKNKEIIKERPGIRISTYELGNFFVISYYNYYNNIEVQKRFIPIKEIKEILFKYKNVEEKLNE